MAELDFQRNQLGTMPGFVSSQNGDIHGVYVYVSLFAGNITRTTRRFLPGTRRVYRFKQYSRGSGWVQKAVNAAATIYDCEEVMVVPGSTPDNTALQDLFGVTIRRVIAVPRRTYAHHRRIPENHAETVEFPRVLCGQRVLLLDDVCTSGRTLRWFGRELADRGVEPVLFCLGLNRRLVAADNTAVPDYLVSSRRQGDD